MTVLIVGGVVVLLVAAAAAALRLRQLYLAAEIEAHRRSEIARARQARRHSEQRINRLAVAAMQQMTDVARRHQGGRR